MFADRIILVEHVACRRLRHICSISMMVGLLFGAITPRFDDKDDALQQLSVFPCQLRHCVSQEMVACSRAVTVRELTKQL